MAGPVGSTAHLKVCATFEYTIEDGLGGVTIMKHVAERRQRLVGGDDNGPAPEVAFVDDTIEHVGGVIDVGEIAEFIGDEHVGLDIGLESFGDGSEAGGVREFADEDVSLREPSIEPVLDSAVRDGDGEMGLAGACGSGKDDVAALGEEFGFRGNYRAF